DAVGTPLASSVSWTFTTAAAPVAPTVTGQTPSPGATNVAAAAPVTATVSTAMAVASITTATFQLQAGVQPPVVATISYDAATQTARLQPAAALTAATLYTATVTGGVTDAVGTPLASPVSWTFTTAAAPVAPRVNVALAANGATATASSVHDSGYAVGGAIDG